LSTDTTAVPVQIRGTLTLDNWLPLQTLVFASTLEVKVLQLS
jgi:hypothetical protein